MHEDPGQQARRLGLVGTVIKERSQSQQDLEIARAGFRLLPAAELVRILKPREHEIMSMRLGHRGEEPLTLTAIAHELQLSRERVRQVQGTAAGKLRKRGVERMLAQELLQMLSNEIRRRILLLGMLGDPEWLSPSKASRAIGISLTISGNHFRLLKDADLLVYKGAKKNRGADEHFYLPRYEALEHPIARSVMTVFASPVNTDLWC